MDKTKGVLIVMDGLGDRPSAALNGQTPLEAAHTPHLNRIVAAGACGMMYPVAPGVPVGTQTGMGVLLGLARADLPQLTRGPVEAAGVGIDLKPGDVALRGNFATLAPQGDGFAILDRRAGRISAEAQTLAEALNGQDLGHGITVQFRASTQHRTVAVLSGPNLSAQISNTDPGASNNEEGLQPCRPCTPGDAEAEATAAAVNAFTRAAYNILDPHPINQARVARGLPPANGVLFRGAGRGVALRNLIRHLRLRAAVVTGEGTVVGLGRLFGFDVITSPAFTATPETDLDAKVAATRTALETHDLVFLHIKGTDVCAHDLQPAAKQHLIERIDAALAPLLDQGLVVGVTGDHTTDSATGRHTGDLVPTCLSAPHIRPDRTDTFGERTCMQGGLGHLSATAFLVSMLDLMNATYNFRAHEYGFFL